MSIKKIRERRQRIIERLREQVELTTQGAKHRSCGECQACCYAIAIHLNVSIDQPNDKPNYSTCPHQCEKGCGIYNNRPGECRTYSCLWQNGVITNEEYRPDRFGVILDYRSTEEQNIPVIVFWETRPGALKEKPVQRLMTWIMNNTKARIAYNEYNKVQDNGSGTIKKRLL